MSFQSKGLGAEAWTATQQGRDIADEGACKILHHKSNSKHINDITKYHNIQKIWIRIMQLCVCHSSMRCNTQVAVL